MQAPPCRPPLLSLMLISAASLAHEVLLIQLLSIIAAPHFAYMVISLALLGFGMSGTVLALWRRRLLARYADSYAVLLSAFGFSVVAGFLLAQRLPFNPEQILWDPWQSLYLLCLSLLLALPFLCAATAIGLVLMRHGRNIARVYAFDLAGAGLGGLALVSSLWWLLPTQALVLIAMLGFIAALLAGFEMRALSKVGTAAILILFTATLAIISGGISLKLSPYKALSQTLRIPGTRIIARQSSPLGLVSVVESPRVPLRHAPGLSLGAATGPPMQFGLFVNGDAMTAITPYRAGLAGLGYLDQMTSAVPYQLGKPRRVLILGAGGGDAVLQALRAGAVRVDAVELNPQIIGQARSLQKRLGASVYDDPRVRIVIDEIRRFMAATDESYDLIQLPLRGSSGTGIAGLHATAEDHVYTLEALQAYLRRLRPGGILALNHWIKLPPRDTLKSLATVIQALAAAGVDDPQQRIALIRGWQTATVLVKAGAFKAADIMALKRFARIHSFDVAYYPGIRAQEANRYNILRTPYFHDAAQALLSPAGAAFMDRYKFNIAPSSDDRPFYYRFSKWGVIQEALASLGKGGASLIEWGFVILIATLIQSVVLGLLLIVAPLALLPRSRFRLPPNRVAAGTLGYFFLIGLGFMFMEIAFIQKFILFLHHPLYAVSVMLTAILVFAGIGSGCSARLAPTANPGRVSGYAIAGIACFAGLNLLLTSVYANALSSLPEVLKIAAAVTLIAPQAMCMGIPFPAALRVVNDTAPALVPWAWGVNGCVSVVSAVLATVVAIFYGFTTVIVIAMLVYFSAGLLFPRRHPAQ